MSAEFLPLWAPDARAFKRATFMSSTDDVKLLGEVQEEEPKGSTTPFGPHSESGEAVHSRASPDLEEVRDDLDPNETLQAEAGEGQPIPAEVEGAIAALEAEVQGPSLDQEAVAALEKESFNRGKAMAMAEMAEKINALEQENERLSGLSSQIEPLVDELGAFRYKMIRQSSEDLAEMALHMARRVVGETLAVRPQALRKLVADALERLPGEDEVTIRVRPEDLSVIENHLPTRRTVRLIGDEELEGGCVVTAQCGEVSASVDAAFQGLRAAVEDWLEEQK
jgi:flagellar assembly protein FliH